VPRPRAPFAVLVLLAAPAGQAGAEPPRYQIPLPAFSEPGYDNLVYHARSYRDIAGDTLFDPNRDTRAQPLGWNADGTPRFQPAQ
jgi:GH43 family beta-xylosidase